MFTKKKIIFSLCAVFGIAAASILLTSSNLSEEDNISELVTIAEDFELITYQTGPLSVYQLENPSSTKLNSYKSLVSKELRNKKADPSIHFKQDARKGSVSFNRGMKKYASEAKLQLPAQKAAGPIAKKFLQTSKMMPKNEKELTLVHSGGLRASQVVKGKGTRPVDKMRTLTYGRKLGNVPVLGSGSKIVVNVGDKNEIVSVIRKWKEVKAGSRAQKVAPSNEKSLKAAQAEVRKIVTEEFGKTAKAVVKKGTKVYYDGAGSHIQPVYAFDVQVMIPGSVEGKPIPYLGIVSALKNAPESVSKDRMPVPREGATKIKRMTKAQGLKYRSKKKDSE